MCTGFNAFFNFFVYSVFNFYSLRLKASVKMFLFKLSEKKQALIRLVYYQVVRFVFEGVEIPLDPSCAVFFTLNPDFTGCIKMPDNLKV